jgi:hypothetical protein
MEAAEVINRFFVDKVAERLVTLPAKQVAWV